MYVCIFPCFTPILLHYSQIQVMKYINNYVIIQRRIKQQQKKGSEEGN